MWSGGAGHLEGFAPSLALTNPICGCRRAGKQRVNTRVFTFQGGEEVSMVQAVIVQPIHVASRFEEAVCHRCGGPTRADPERPGWMCCPGCGPVWMPFDNNWIKVSVAAGAGERTARMLTEVAAA